MWPGSWAASDNVCEIMNLGNFNILMSEDPILYLLIRFFSVGTFSNKNLVNFTRKKKHKKSFEAKLKFLNDA